MRKITKITYLVQYSSSSFHYKDVHGCLWFRNPFSTTSPDDELQIKDRKLWLGIRDASKMICSGMLKYGSRRFRGHEFPFGELSIYFTPLYHFV